MSERTVIAKAKESYKEGRVITSLCLTYLCRTTSDEETPREDEGIQFRSDFFLFSLQMIDRADDFVIERDRSNQMSLMRRCEQGVPLLLEGQ